jgi:hypothetical protein
MNRKLVVGVIACIAGLWQDSATAAEGLVAEKPPVLESSRVARYAKGVAKAESKSAPDIQSHKASRAAVSEKTARTNTERSTRFSDFYIYGATSTLRSDRDADGYHAEFRIRFDADVLFGDAWVYAKLYLRRAGESQWFLYRETDDFYIQGQSSSDEYYVTTTLDAGYPTAEYDVLIDLYESGFNGIVATLGPLDSGALSYLPLEEAGLDVPIALPGFSIDGVATDLMGDADDDGFHSRFRITFDADAEFGSSLLYARIWVRPRGGDWVEEFVSEDFSVDVGGSDADAYVLDTEWVSGYPTSLYDVQIDLYDSASDLLVASAGSDRLALSQIPLEDQSLDRRVSSPTPPSGGDSSSREGGGGSWSVLGLLGLALAVLARTVQRRRLRRLG